MSYADELKSVYGVLLAVSRVLAKHSPVLFLQRYIRGWMVRKALVKSTNQRIRCVFIGTANIALCAYNIAIIIIALGRTYNYTTYM